MNPKLDKRAAIRGNKRLKNSLFYDFAKALKGSTIIKTPQNDTTVRIKCNLLRGFFFI